MAHYRTVMLWIAQGGPQRRRNLLYGPVRVNTRPHEALRCLNRAAQDAIVVTLAVPSSQTSNAPEN